LSQLVDKNDFGFRFNINKRPLNFAGLTRPASIILDTFSDKNHNINDNRKFDRIFKPEKNLPEQPGGVDQFIKDLDRRCFSINFGDDSLNPIVFNGGEDGCRDSLLNFKDKLSDVKLGSKPGSGNLYDIMDNLYASGLVDGSFLNLIVKTFFLNHQLRSFYLINVDFQEDISHKVSAISVDTVNDQPQISFTVRNTKEVLNSQNTDKRLNIKFNCHDDSLDQDACIAESKVDLIYECILNSDGVTINLSMPDQISNALFYSDNLLKMLVALFETHKSEEIIYLLEKLIENKNLDELNKFILDERLTVYELMSLYEKCFPVPESLDGFVGLLENRLQSFIKDVGVDDFYKLGLHLNKVDSDIDFHLKSLYKDCYRGNFGADKNIGLRSVMNLASIRYDKCESLNSKCSKSYFMCLALFSVALPLVFNKTFFGSRSAIVAVAPFYDDNLDSNIKKVYNQGDLEKNNLLGLAVA
jgi:hypothetical protein